MLRVCRLLAALSPVFASWVACGQPEPGTLFGVQIDDRDARLIQIDTATGAAHAVGSPLGFDVDGLAFDGDLLYAVDNTNKRLVRLDPLTGEVAEDIGPFGDFYVIDGLSANPLTGSLAGVDLISGRLVTISRSSGQVFEGRMILTPGGASPPITGLAWSPDGGTLYATSFSGTLYEVDRGTGIITAIGSSSGSALGFDIDATSGIAYGVSTNPAELQIVDLATGVRTTVGPTGFQEIEGLAFVRPRPVVPAVLGREPFTTASLPVTGDSVSELRVMLSVPVNFDDGDIEIENASGSPVAFASSGSGGQVVTLALEVPISGDSYRVTLRDTIESVADGSALDGDGDGSPGADAVLEFTHRCAGDDNFDGQVSPADFTAWIMNFNAGCP